MLKKYVSILILGLLTMISVSGLYWGYTPAVSNGSNLAPSSGNNQPVISNAASISVTGFQTPPMSDFAPSQVVVGATAADEPYPSPYPGLYPTNYSPSSGDTNFRIAHTWNGIKIPSMDVTGSLGVVGATAADEPYPSLPLPCQLYPVFC